MYFSIAWGLNPRLLNFDDFYIKVGIKTRGAISKKTHIAVSLLKLWRIAGSNADASVSMLTSRFAGSSAPAFK